MRMEQNRKRRGKVKGQRSKRERSIKKDQADLINVAYSMYAQLCTFAAMQIC